ncbi:Major facilitator superfamily domain [Phytophthora cactorum]|nr:Major facilitator superfamily domain [Phytophthora cactorum]
MPTRYIALQMLQDRALWELRGPRTRRASTAELRRRSSTNGVSPPYHSASSASTHRPVGKLVESTSDFSLLVAYVEAHGLVDEDAESVDTAIATKSLLEDEEVEEVEEEEQEELKKTSWQLSKEVMFMVSAFVVLFTSGGLILGFGPVYSMLVREKQWAELCTEEEQESDGGVLCAAQEVRLHLFNCSGILAPIGLVDGMREELKRQDLWFFALLFGWVSLIFAFAGGAIPSLLVNLAGDDTSAASLYTNILYPILVNGTFWYSPAVGYVIDHYGFKVIFLACIALVQLFIALLLVPSLRVQLAMFFVYAMAQTCLYALQFAYIIMCFPAELYGTLQAFLATVSFSFGLLNYVINPWTQVYFDGNYTVALLFLGLPTILFYGFIHVVQGCEHHTVSHKAKNAPTSRDSPAEESTRLL